MNVLVEFKRNGFNFHKLTFLKFEVCDSLKQTLIPFFESIKRITVPGLLCPAKGTDGQVNNFTIPTNDVALFPEGYYRYYVHFEDGFDVNIYQVNLTHRVRNTLYIQDFK